MVKRQAVGRLASLDPSTGGDRDSPAAIKFKIDAIPPVLFFRTGAAMDFFVPAVVLSAAIAAVALHILLKEQDPRRREGAMWLLGVLMGYWLR